VPPHEQRPPMLWLRAQVCRRPASQRRLSVSSWRPLAAAAAAARPMATAAAEPAPAVFVYGSLMHPAVVKAIIGRMPCSTPAVVPGYVRRRVIEEAYPACVPVSSAAVDPSSTGGGGGGGGVAVAAAAATAEVDSPEVRGLLLHDCTERERCIFDLFEEIDEDPALYARVVVQARPLSDEERDSAGTAAVPAYLYEWVRGEGYLEEEDWSFEAFSQPAVLAPYLEMCREFVDEEVTQFYR
jgi:hypothetical protein